jgi:hypothetical protein
MLEQLQVASDRDLGDPHELGQRGDAYDAVLAQELLDAPVALRR